MPTASELQHFEISDEDAAGATFVKGRGCKNCQNTGYRGRKAVFELMTMNAGIREMTFRSEATQNIRRLAHQGGMRTLVDDAKDKAMEGVTTLFEVDKLMKSSDA